MEFKVDFLGIIAALKLAHVWHLFSQAGPYAESQLVILKVGHYLHILFEQTIHFCKNIYDLPSFYHCKGTSNVSVGGSD